ncbi:unnamed protein product [marine sediment metagenome]|uniref:Uncharacterized protein n=1 Tax=marine sediment metagenome TaxID=412755 RepID=X1R5Z0_9ZZZZ
MKLNTKTILSELKNHIPFTLLATLIAVILVGIIYKESILISESFFYIIHPLHLFVSAIVSAAIFYKYKNNFIQALLIGITGSIIIGSLSDIILPYLGGTLFQLKTSFHLSLIEKPILILSTVIIGSIVGIITKFTKTPHFFHVFLSVFASLLYLLAFSTSLNPIHFIAIFFIVFIAVLVPCCVSDIVFPLLFVRRKNEKKNI